MHIETERGVVIDATTNHPFYVEGKGWTAAGDLAIGDAFHALSDDVGVVTDLTLEKLDVPILVYDLDVADFDTYFVGDGVLVHNEYNVTETTTGERAVKKLSPEQKGFYEKAKKALQEAENLTTQGDNAGLHVHFIGNDTWTADLKGFGKGRGRARIEMRINEREKTIEIFGISKDHMKSH